MHKTKLLCNDRNKKQNGERRSVFSTSVVVPVVPDVLHIVRILQHVDELLHVLHVALVGERDVVLRHHLDVSVDKGIALGLFNNSKVSILVTFSPCMS